jgi:hypothetical protein
MQHVIIARRFVLGSDGSYTIRMIFLCRFGVRRATPRFGNGVPYRESLSRLANIVHPKDVRSPCNCRQGRRQRTRQALLGWLVTAQPADEALARYADHQSAPESLILI